MTPEEAREYLKQFRDDGDENVDDLEPVLAWRLARAFEESPELRQKLRIESAVRTEKEQRYLFDGYKSKRPGFNLAADPDRVIGKYGSKVWRGSYHMAQDGLGYAVDVTRKGGISWSKVHKLLTPWGLKRTVRGENWHYQAGNIEGSFEGPLPGGKSVEAPAVKYRLIKLRRPRMRGPFVKWIQEITGSTPDGIFGPKSRARVVVWQRSKKLTPDGVVGPATFAAMKKENKK